MRVLLDTHIFIWYAKEQDKLSKDVLSILSDYENEVYVSSETLRELVVLWNKKEHIRKWWKTALDLVRSVEDVYGFRVLYLHKEHYEAYSKLQLNVAQEHYDPSDHLIVSHAITNHLTLISADGKFPFYRNQGLDLIENT
jgi:PIN domain nuclease of toxin-antitoxin system